MEQAAKVESELHCARFRGRPESLRDITLGLHPGVKAIGVVSSFAAIGDFSTPADQQDGKVYNENDWLPWTDEYAETLKA